MIAIYAASIEAIYYKYTACQICKPATAHAVQHALKTLLEHHPP